MEVAQPHSLLQQNPLHHFSPSSFTTTPRTRLIGPTKSQAPEEIRVCTNRTCRRQGSMQTLQNLTDLSPPNVVVKSCGCLGRCGSGPNVVVLPQAVIVGHCGTASQAARVVCGPGKGDEGDVRRALEALELRKRAEGEIERSSFSHAEMLLSQAINLEPYGGIHILYRLRSIARLALRNHSGALEDARKASSLAPHYVEAYICEGEALMALEQYDAAENSYAVCLQIDPLVRRSKAFKIRIAKLQEKLTAAANISI